MTIMDDQKDTRKAAEGVVRTPEEEAKIQAILEACRESDKATRKAWWASGEPERIFGTTLGVAVLLIVLWFTPTVVFRFAFPIAGIGVGIYWLNKKPTKE